MASENIVVRNMAPRGRNVGRPQDRETVEKSRLHDRSFGYQRYHPDVIDKPFAVPSNSAGFISDADRLHTDVVGDIKKRRDERIANYQSTIEVKRAEATVREDSRWESFEKQQLKEDAKWQTIRSDANNTMARRNNISVPYDPITLQYHDNLNGKRMQYADNMIKYRAECRAENLRSHGNSSVNPITGESLSLRPPPQPPVKSFVDPFDSLDRAMHAHHSARGHSHAIAAAASSQQSSARANVNVSRGQGNRSSISF